MLSLRSKLELQEPLPVLRSSYAENYHALARAGSCGANCMYWWLPYPSWVLCRRWWGSMRLWCDFCSFLSCLSLASGSQQHRIRLRLPKSQDSCERTRPRAHGDPSAAAACRSRFESSRAAASPPCPRMNFSTQGPRFETIGSGI